jgi:hypothetical protein
MVTLWARFWVDLDWRSGRYKVFGLSNPHLQISIGGGDTSNI